MRESRIIVRAYLKRYRPRRVQLASHPRLLKYEEHVGCLKLKRTSSFTSFGYEGIMG